MKSHKQQERTLSFIKFQLALNLHLVSLPGCFFRDEDPDYSVVQYEGEAFVESDVLATWSFEVDGDRLIIREHPSEFFDEQAQLLWVTLEDIGNELPSLVDVWYGPENGGIGSVIKKSRLEVQSWDLSGEISGVFKSDLPTGGNLFSLFWIDLSESE